MNYPVGLKKIATLCVLRGEQGLLLLRRNKEPHLGKYIPIGGKLEPYETPRQGAVREIFEETGIEIEEGNLKLAGIMTETSPTKFNWVNYVFWADISAEPSGFDTDEGFLEWVNENAIHAIPTPTTDRFICMTNLLS